MSEDNVVQLDFSTGEGITDTDANVEVEEHFKSRFASLSYKVLESLFDEMGPGGVLSMLSLIIENKMDDLDMDDDLNEEADAIYQTWADSTHALSVKMLGDVERLYKVEVI